MNNNLRKQKGENYSICCKLWKKDQSSIKCYNCKKFLHGPIAKSKSLSCSLLTLDEFNLYTNPSLNKSTNHGCVLNVVQMNFLSMNVYTNGSHLIKYCTYLEIH